jgi:hypothetical protein
VRVRHSDTDVVIRGPIILIPLFGGIGIATRARVPRALLI